jgi:hypothetical protein
MSETYRTITVAKTVKEEEQVEVRFPLFVKHDLMMDDSNIVIYMRIDPLLNGKFACVSITERHDYRDGKRGFEIEREPYSFDTRSDPDYLLGRGEHELTEEQFGEVWKRADAFLATLREPSL